MFQLGTPPSFLEQIAWEHQSLPRVPGGVCVSSETTGNMILKKINMRVHFKGGERKDTWVLLDEVLWDSTFKVVPLNKQLLHQRQREVKEKPLRNCWAIVVIIYLLDVHRWACVTKV